MNVMLVSVTERTREIGVRVAVGATEEAIQLQFLGESIMLSLVGGAAGVLFGVFGSYLVGQTLHWPIQMSLESVVIAAIFFRGRWRVFWIPTRRERLHCSTPSKRCDMSEHAGFDSWDVK